MTKKSDPALNDASVALADDPNTAAVAVVETESNLDPDDPALTGIPRDERHDSIDRNTGTLTDEAVALRAERGAEAE